MWHSPAFICLSVKNFFGRPANAAPHRNSAVGASDRRVFGLIGGDSCASKAAEKGAIFSSCCQTRKVLLSILISIFTAVLGGYQKKLVIAAVFQKFY
jgi:hypothetical protein